MSKSILHITNGDITTNYLKKLNFSGDFITWREMLCEGKTTNNVGSDTFWKSRYNFLKTSYKISKQKFIDYTLKEYRTLCNKKNTEEIILWFDHDLFCQINMLAVLSWLKRYRKGYHISLVSSSKNTILNKTKNISELTEKEIYHSFNKRKTLIIDDIEYADYIWQLYCSDSPLRLEAVYKFNPMFQFQHLSTAIETHISRFPSIENGLNKIENKILKTVNENTFSSRKKMIQKLLKNEKIYGFGDIQYNNKVNNLKKLFHSFNPVKLNNKGKEVLKNKINFYSQIRNDISFLGGAKKYSYLFNNESEKLLQITT